MAIKQIVEDVLKKPMNRKEFLGKVGTLLLAVFGVMSILHALGGERSTTQHSASQGATLGYGNSPYGGSTEG